MSLDLPKSLVDSVREGRVVLLLGAGASIGARRPNGDAPPDGNTLKNLIATRFLDSNHASDTLAWVAELASSAADLYTVQDFIAEQFADLEPAEFHYRIPAFRWRAIATTNFDRVIERVYEAVEDRIQSVVPFISNEDRVDRKLREGASVPLVKLHGCITRTHQKDLPLVLSIDQYADYRRGRDRLFSMLQDLGAENTVVFIGHRGQDPSLRAVMLELDRSTGSRPRYYLVRPQVPDVERDLWARKNTTVIEATFEEFIGALDAAVPLAVRPLLRQYPDGHPISKRYVIGEEPSAAVLELLETDLELVDDAIPVRAEDPKRFYSGFGLGWFPIVRSLDVRRRLTSDLLQEIVLRPEEDRPAKVELYLVKAEAGAGKTILLRRLAWEAATQAGVIALFKRAGTGINTYALRDLVRAVGQRVFLFVDNAGDHVRSLRDLLDFCRREELPVTVVTAERINEWNTRCEDLQEVLTDEFQLRYLSHAEIEDLVHLLRRHDSLGPNLVQKTLPEQISEFEKRAGRQLLVALHEATLGRPFEEILLDEYQAIIPPEAQRLYLTVCVLHRLKVPVRAGVISRVHNIPFEEFKTRLFRPLEHVVHVGELPWGDLAYRTRHSEIAQIVFEQVLVERQERFNEYVRVLRNLNPLYSVDEEALRGMINAKAVHDLFPEYQDAVAVYEAAAEGLGEDAHLLQQIANYERIRPSGNLRRAEQLLERARELDPTDETIRHTLAEVLLARADAADHYLERVRLRKSVRAVLREIGLESRSARYVMVTRLKADIAEVRDVLELPDASDRDIDESIRGFERTLEVARQRFPGDSHIISQESSLAALLEDSDRTLRALEEANRANPRDPYIATRLAGTLTRRGRSQEAKEVFEAALDANRSDRQLHFQYAELLRSEGVDHATLAYHYRRAFTKGDRNYDAQFWYARYLYMSNIDQEVGEAKVLFRSLRAAAVPHKDRIAVRDVIAGAEGIRRFSGAVVRLNAAHGFVQVDGRGDWVFFHSSDILPPTELSDLKVGGRVSFKLGFSLGGPKALDVILELAPSNANRADVAPRPPGSDSSS